MSQVSIAQDAIPSSSETRRQNSVKQLSPVVIPVRSFQKFYDKWFMYLFFRSPVFQTPSEENMALGKQHQVGRQSRSDLNAQY